MAVSGISRPRPIGEVVMVALIDQVFQIFSGNMIDIPLIRPIVDFLMSIPLIKYLVALILWKPFFAVILVPGLTGLMLSLLFIIWFERKLTARIQWRMGPLEISRSIGGILQPLADGMRYFFQEIIIHREAHRPYFVQFPILAFIPILLPVLFIPAGSVYAMRSGYALPIIVSLISMIPVVIMAIGWASNSRLAYIGTVREAFMYFAYEIPFILAVLAMAILYGTSDLFLIAEKQKIWGIALNPVSAIVFIVTMAMATSRLPFEIPEADQEIAFGPFVEYSGILFGLTMTLAYEKMYILGLLFSVLFLGGGSGPMIPLLGELSPVIWLYIKAVIIMCIMAFLRAVYPRYRIDQALRIGWTYLAGLAVVSIAIAGIISAGGLLP